MLSVTGLRIITSLFKPVSRTINPSRQDELLNSFLRDNATDLSRQTETVHPSRHPHKNQNASPLPASVHEQKKPANHPPKTLQGESFWPNAARITCTIINQDSTVAFPPFLPPGQRQENASESEAAGKI